MPMLGVCLGHQAIGHAFGGDGGARAGADARQDLDGRARRPRRLRRPDRRRSRPARYHSLVVADDGLPDELEVTARPKDDGARDGRCAIATLPMHGVQFHPESVLTNEGRRILRNFLEHVMMFAALIDKLARQRGPHHRRGGAARWRAIMRGEAHAGADRRAAGRPGDERRAAGRARRLRADDARERGARSRRRPARCSTPAAPAAIARAPSTSRPPPRSCSPACGMRVAKHGNRSVSSQCGSADVLEALGVNIQAPPAVVERCLAEVGVAFFFAPTFHPAMRHAGAGAQGARRAAPPSTCSAR